MTQPTFDFSQLSPEQRLELIGELWDSLDDELPPPDSAFAVELDRRVDQLHVDPDAALPAADVIARIRAALK